MGTRSTYRVIEQWTDNKTKKVKNENLVLLYLQFDGYPEGHPLETAEWLSSGMVVNGFGLDDDKLQFNGAGCLAAQLVDRLKNGVGGAYIHSLSSRGKSWEDYTYDIIVKEDKSIEFIAYEVEGLDKPTFKQLFIGSPNDFVTRFKTSATV
jgi:hypothetical protein